MLEQLIRFVTDEGAATAIEYALMLGLVTLAIVGSIQYVSTSLDGLYNYVSSSVTGAM